MTDIKESNNKVSADCHSLYTSTKTTTVKNYRVFITEFAEGDTKIHDIWNRLLSGGKNDTLELRISSCGGAVTECQQFVNLIRNKFNKRTTTYIDSHASSAGAVVFCSGDKRVVFENSRIMLHNYSGGYGGKYRDVKDRLDFDEEHIIGFLKSVIKVGPKGFLTKSEFNAMVNGKNFWFNSEEMLKRGIATHIVINGEELTAKEYLKTFRE